MEENIKNFEQVRHELDAMFNGYSDAENRLWELCHQVLSNALFVLNKDEVEDTFTFEFPMPVKTSVGGIKKVSTIPCDGVVWFTTEAGVEYDDDSEKIPVTELYNIATSLYAMTEPLGAILNMSEQDVLGYIEDTAEIISDNHGMNVSYCESMDMTLLPVIVETMLQEEDEGAIDDLHFFAENGYIIPLEFAHSSIEEIRSYLLENKYAILRNIVEICDDYRGEYSPSN